MSGQARPWPPGVGVHTEWGSTGAELAAEEGDIVVIVDLLSFSTSVALTVGQGATALSYSEAEIDRWGGRQSICDALEAEIVAKDRAATDARFSLSPASLASIGPGDRLIFTSLNGASCTSAASRAPLVIVGCLLNRTAVARVVADALAAGEAHRCTLVAAAEHWSSTTDRAGVRPGIEDFIGVGAIADALIALGIDASPEAEMAAAAFRDAAPRMLDLLQRCISGRELIESGFGADVELAVDVDSIDVAPVWHPRREMREFSPARPGSD